MKKDRLNRLENKWQNYCSEDRKWTDIIRRFLPSLGTEKKFKDWIPTYEPVDLYKSDSKLSFDDLASSHKFVFFRHDGFPLVTFLKNISDATHAIFIADSEYSKTSTLKFIEFLYTKQIYHSQPFGEFQDWGKTVDNREKIELETEVFCPIYVDLSKLQETQQSKRTGFWRFVFQNTVGKREADLWKELTESRLYILLFDSLDQLFKENTTLALKLLKRLRRIKSPWIIATRRHPLKLSEHLDEKVASLFEVLPLSRQQRLRLIKKIVNRYNQQLEKDKQIALHHARAIEEITPSLIHSEESQNPAFIIAFTECLLKLLKEKAPYYRATPFKEFELYDFYNNAMPTEPKNLSTREPIASAKSFRLFDIARRNSKAVINKIRGSQIIDNFYLFPHLANQKFNDSFFYRRLFMSNLAHGLEPEEGVQTLHKFFRSLFEALCDEIQLNCHNLGEDPKKQSIIKACFECLALLLKYLKKSYQILFRDLQATIFDRMCQHFYADNYPALIRWYSLWIMRLSFDPNASSKSLVDLGKKILDGVTIPDSAEKHCSYADEVEIDFAALLFLAKFFLVDHQLASAIVSKILSFIEACPLSGFILYAYLEHGKEKFGEAIEPILSSMDKEPRVSKVEDSSKISSYVAARAIQALGAFGNEKDINRLIAHGFLNINATLVPTETRTREIALIERVTHYAIEEIFYHQQKFAFDPCKIRPFAVSLSQVFTEKLPSIYDRFNQCLSIYSKIYSDFHRRMQQGKLRGDPQRQLDLLAKAGAIFNAVNKKYFRDKSYAANKGHLKLSLRELERELKILHQHTASLYEIKDDTLWFEENTVKTMREIVESHVKEKPEDLIDLSHISFKRWYEGKKLGSPDTPQFSKYMKKKPQTCVPHVVKSNRDILKSIPKIQKYPEKVETLHILDIGAGIGNTTEAIIEYYFPSKRRHIYAVELVSDFVRHYSRRIRILTALKYYLNEQTRKEINYEVDCYSEDIHKFLETIVAKDRTIEFKNKNQLRGDEHYQFVTHSGIRNSAEIVQYLETLGCKSTLISKLSRCGRKNDSSDDQFQKSYGRFYRVFNSIFRTYSNIPGPTKFEFEPPHLQNDFDLIIANYVLHHLTKDYRKDIYRWLLTLSREKAVFAISDPNLGISHYNLRYFNFTDEGVFACFSQPSEYTKEVESVVEDGYYWKKVDAKPDDVGFHLIFQKVAQKSS